MPSHISAYHRITKLGLLFNAMDEKRPPRLSGSIISRGLPNGSEVVRKVTVPVRHRVADRRDRTMSSPISLLQRHTPCIQSGCVSMLKPISPRVMSTITAVMLHITRILDFSFCCFLFVMG